MKRLFVYGQRCGSSRRNRWALSLLGLALCLTLSPAEAAATKSKKMTTIPKWSKFEQEFRSTIAYTNAIQEANLTVAFTSPLGETSRVEGFWDGGRTWRVRFSPDQPGRWTYETHCSDAFNTELNAKTGEFLCTSPVGQSRFLQHGPVVVSRDHRHLEQADGTPFFWLGDAVWNAARVSQLKEWQLYAEVRSSQNFSVAQWAVAPGGDSEQQSALTGFPERIGVNVEVFKRLDLKVETLGRFGLLNAIVPIAELFPKADLVTLPDDQALLLARYVVARWGAEPVVWMLAFEPDADGTKAARWKKLGRQVFGTISHAPVVLYTGKNPSVLNEFQDETWVDVFAFNAALNPGDQTLAPAVSSWLAQQIEKKPARPLVAFTPMENSVDLNSGKRFNADDLRHAAYTSLLQASAAGVTYAGRGVADWDKAANPKDQTTPGASLPLFEKALFMPGAKQMGQLGNFISSLPYWQLRPQAAAVPAATDTSSCSVAAITPEHNLGLVYLAAGRSLNVFLDAMPKSPAVTWFDPRTGQTSPAVAVVAQDTCQFPAPQPGDWVLVIKGGK